jgi:uncharacterized protein YqeY
MSLSDKLNEDMKTAMKSQDKFKLSVIRMVRSSIKNLEIDLKKSLSDEETLDVIQKEVKQRKDALQEFEKANRMDLADPLRLEIQILTSYMPEQLSEDDVKAIIQQTIIEAGATSKADMGKVMTALMPKIKGRADGKIVNQLVQQLLG